MLDDDLTANELYRIALDRDRLDRERISDLLDHPACYPQLEAWLESVRSGIQPDLTKVEPPPPPPGEEVAVDPLTQRAEPPAPKRRWWKRSTIVVPLAIVLVSAGAAGVWAVTNDPGEPTATPTPVITASESTPEPEETPEPEPAPEYVSAGGEAFTCSGVIGQAGLRCVGANDLGQLGAGSADPTVHSNDVLLPAGLVDLVAGEGFACALTEGNKAVCWGDNRWRQAADSEAPVVGPTPATVDGVEALSAGKIHTCALTTKAEVYCWGSDHDGQVTGTAGENASGPKVVGLPVMEITSVVASEFSTCVFGEPAPVCWGSNAGKRITDSDEAILAPVTVSGAAPGAE